MILGAWRCVKADAGCPEDRGKGRSVPVTSVCPGVTVLGSKVNDGIAEGGKAQGDKVQVG